MSDLDNEEKIKILNEKRDKLFTEDNELFEKIIRLEDFLCSKRRNEISDSQINLLEVQFQIMRTYHQILRARINDFGDEMNKLKSR